MIESTVEPTVDPTECFCPPDRQKPRTEWDKHRGADGSPLNGEYRIIECEDCGQFATEGRVAE